jgi:hypothetical protein
MKNPYLISLRPSTLGPTERCVSAIGEGQEALISIVNAPVVAAPDARYNLMRQPFAETDGSLWTFTNCSHLASMIEEDGRHMMQVAGLTAGATIQSPVCRFQGSGPHTMSIQLCNWTATNKTATVTFLINLRADGTEGGVVVNPTLTLPVPALTTVAFTQTVTPNQPWFQIKVDNLASWGGEVELCNPMVNPGTTLDPFFSYRSASGPGLPNPGRVESSGYRFTVSFSSLASCSNVGWLFHPVARQWAVNSYFRAGATGYTVTNGTASNDVRYKVFNNGGGLGLSATAANARIAQTITVTAGLRAVMMAFVLNRGPATRTIQIRAGGVVIGAQNVPTGQEGMIIAEYTGTGAAVSFDLNVLNSTTGGNELTVVHYFGLVTANGYFPAPLPFLDPGSGAPYLGTFTGAADVSMWDSTEVLLGGISQSTKSPGFYYFDGFQGSVIMRHYDLPQLPGAADTTKSMFSFHPTWGTQEMFGSRKITPRRLAHSVRTSVAPAQIYNMPQTALDNGRSESCLQWSNLRSELMVNQTPGGMSFAHVTLNPPVTDEAERTVSDYVIGSNGPARSMASIVTAVLLGRRWITQTQYIQLVNQDVWTHNTPVLPSGRMRVRAISGGRMRIRVVGSGSADA